MTYTATKIAGGRYAVTNANGIRTAFHDWNQAQAFAARLRQGAARREARYARALAPAGAL